MDRECEIRILYPVISWDSRARVAKSNLDGSFVLHDIELGVVYTLGVEVPGRDKRETAEVEWRSQDDLVSVPVDRAFSVRIEVVDEAQQPIPTATVFVDYAEEAPARWGTGSLDTATDEGGIGVMSLPGPPGRLQVGAFAPGFEPTRGAVQILDRDHAVARLQLRRGIGIRIAVKDAHGIPVPNARVRVMAMRSVRAESGADTWLLQRLRIGTAKWGPKGAPTQLELTTSNWTTTAAGTLVAGCPASTASVVMVVVDHDGHFTEYRRIEASRIGVGDWIDAGDIVLRDVGDEVAVQLIQSGTREPLAMARVYFLLDEIPQEAQVLLPELSSDSEGWVRSKLIDPASSYRVTAWPLRREGDSSSNMPFVAHSVCAKNGVSIELHRFDPVSGW